jgi:hypothetical protein
VGILALTPLAQQQQQQLEVRGSQARLSEEYLQLSAADGQELQRCSVGHWLAEVAASQAAAAEVSGVGIGHVEAAAACVHVSSNVAEHAAQQQAFTTNGRSSSSSSGSRAASTGVAEELHMQQHARHPQQQQQLCDSAAACGAALSACAAAGWKCCSPGSIDLSFEWEAEIDPTAEGLATQVRQNGGVSVYYVHSELYAHLCIIVQYVNRLCVSRYALCSCCDD